MIFKERKQVRKEEEADAEEQFNNAKEQNDKAKEVAKQLRNDRMKNNYADMVIKALRGT